MLWWIRSSLSSHFHPALFPFLLILSFPPLSFHSSDIIKVSMTPAKAKREGDFFKSKEEGEREWQTGNVRACECEMSNRKTKHGSEGLICVLRPFLTLSSELSAGSREVRVDECLSCITMARSASTFYFILCPPPDLSDCLASFSFFPCAFTSPVSLMWHTHTLSGLLIPLTHTLFEFRPISVNSKYSLCWLIHILSSKFNLKRNHLNNKSLSSR